MRLVAVLLAAAVVQVAGAPPVRPMPNRAESVKFAVLGDNGTGDAAQYEVADQMWRARQAFSYDLVIMMGDNFYGSQKPADLVKKFDRPYAKLLEAGVVFRAALGNHDEAHTVDYPPLNMHGRRYYTFAAGQVRFFVLDTNNLDPAQLAWFQGALAAAHEPWRICYFHHPLYSNAGRHGSAVDLRVLLEPLLVRHGVQAVFSGHDHSYERLKPQQGIHYFVSGAGGKLRAGDIEVSGSTAAYFDRDRSFMIVEVGDRELTFQAISRLGTVVDSGVIPLTVPELGAVARPRPFVEALAAVASAHVAGGLP